MSHKELFGVFSLLIAVVSYIPYFIALYRKRIHPHAFSYGVWSLLSAIGFCAQVSGNAGPGSWALGFTAFSCGVVAVMAYRNEGLGMTGTDWLSVLGILVAIPLWYYTHDPLPSLIIAVSIDAMGFYPTFRRNYFKPHADMLFMYSMSGLKFAVALFALEQYSAITVLYPAYLFISNFLFVIMVLLRRHIFKPAKD